MILTKLTANENIQFGFLFYQSYKKVKNKKKIY